ncbi:MAG: hypothetical protein Q4E64_06245 [Phascolarctobacterium sp.]|uniref:hypothetical protein n=1 Tax=Phascolarctobacterium sp. TaxID=2049039 RepID=UPI0026DD7721|nr:hypothetical protein [Phascolarctobacterium sp.]MDO4921406.1 hypothetical protein [Phascolarctobacterium sp.]
MSIDKKTLVLVSCCSLVGLLIGGFIGYSYAPLSRTGDTYVHNQKTSSPLQANTETVLSVTPKTSESDPDVVVENSYVAVVNGEKIAAPVETSKDDTTATIKTTVDLTPLVKQMTPKWEVGIGVSYNRDTDISDKKILPCVSVQRNYKHDKAVEVIINADTHGNVKGGSVLHKWLF